MKPLQQRRYVMVPSPPRSPNVFYNHTSSLPLTPGNYLFVLRVSFKCCCIVSRVFRLVSLLSIMPWDSLLLFHVSIIHYFLLLSSFHGMEVPFLYSISRWEIFGLFPVWYSYEKHCYKHLHSGFCKSIFPLIIVNSQEW